MSTETENYGFIKDDETDFYSVLRVNANLDKIDQALTSLSTKIAEGSTITDPQTKSKYKWGIENGLVYLQEVE